MHPVLIDFGLVNLPLLGEVRLALPAYGTLFASGVLLAGWWFIRRARSLGFVDDSAYNLAFYSLLAGIVGGKLALVLVDFQLYWNDPAKLLSTLRSGGVLLGGIIAGAATFTYYTRRHGLPIWILADAVAAPLALAQSVGRLGCYSAGCCYGRLADSVATHWPTCTFSHPETLAHPTDVPLVATQLMESSYDILLALFLTILWRRRGGVPGTIFWIYVILYSLGRAGIEFLRGDVERGVYFGGLLSTSQILAGAALLLAVFMLFRLHRAHRAERRTP